MLLTIRNQLILTICIITFCPSLYAKDISKKILTNNKSDDAIFESIKNTIKPVDLKDEPVVIKYDMPLTHLDIKLNQSVDGKSLKGAFITKSVTDSENVDSLIYKAYKAANIGSIEAAINIYKQVLKLDETNTNALFSLGALYQKLNQLGQAKAIYIKLFGLKEYSPDVINNYLALISKEAPSQALIQLQDLERTNPNYSPVKAQIGMIYATLHEFEMAENYLLSAIKLAPEVINYRYNLAVLYDKMNKQALALNNYRQVLEFSGNQLSGQTINNIRERIAILQNSIS